MPPQSAKTAGIPATWHRTRPDLVLTVLTAANQPLRPQEVIHQAERVHGYAIAPSSIRNCLREAANRRDGTIERLGYGRYGIRTPPPG